MRMLRIIDSGAPSGELRTKQLLFILPLVALTTGCGLEAYDRKFEKETERIKKFDEADQMLGNLIEFPLKIGVNAQGNFQSNNKFFFRAPIVIALKPDGLPIDGLFYRYPRAGSASAAAVTPIKGTAVGRPAAPTIFGPLKPELEKEGGIREMYIGISPDNKPVDFRNNLLKTFKGAKQEPGRIEKRFGMDDVKYDVWSWSDAAKPTSLFSIYMTQSDGMVVALVYHVGKEKGTTAVIKSAIAYSLQSLVLGANAELLRTKFMLRPPPKNPPKM